MTEGGLSASPKSTKNAFFGFAEEKAAFLSWMSRNAVTVRESVARRLSVLFWCLAKRSPSLRDCSMKMTPRRSATVGKLPLPLSVRAPSMCLGAVSYTHLTLPTNREV